MMKLPKTKASWKRLQANSVKDALRLNKEYARTFKRLTVPAIAELMAISEDRLYKWLSTGDMPTSYIPAYEHICGVQYVTQYLGIRTGKILIDIPNGRNPKEIELAALQKLSAHAISLLINHYHDDEDADIDKTSAALTRLLQGVAYHRENIKAQPELDLYGDEDE